MTSARLGLVPIRKHGRLVARYGIFSQPAQAPPHPFSRLCSALPGARCPACGDAQAGSLESRVREGRVRA